MPLMLLDIFLYSAVFYIGTELTSSAVKKFKARRATRALQVVVCSWLCACACE